MKRYWMLGGCLLLTVLVIGAIACSSSSNNTSKTQTAEFQTPGATAATETPQATTGTPQARTESTPPNIRGLDLNSQVQASLCGPNPKPPATPFCRAGTMYADLFGDGGEEAIVIVFSGGTAGNNAVVVFGYVGGALREVLREVPPAEAYSGHIQALLSSSGQLVIQWPIYQQGEPNCCPTGGYRTRYYRWDGSALVVDRETILQLGQAP